MADSWEDLVTPVRNGVNAMLNYLPGYATERERFLRRVRDGGPNRQDVADALFNAMSAIGAGPRPGIYGWAARREAVPQADPAITGGGSRFDPVAPPNSSMQLTRRPEVLTAAGVKRPHHKPPERDHPVVANDNVAGPLPVAQTKGGNPPANAVTQDRVTALLESLGARITQVKEAGGTTYIKFEPPSGPRLPFQAQPTIRIPSDGHAGRPMRPSEAGVLFDTASESGRVPLNPLTTMDDSGRPFSDFRVLEDTLRRRFGPTQEAPAVTPRGPDNSPDQPRLLSVAAPAAIGGWATTVTRDDELAPSDRDPGRVGQFAAPLVTPEDQLAADTRSLTDRVSAATRSIHSDFDWSDLVEPVRAPFTPHAMAGMRRSFNAMAGS